MNFTNSAGTVYSNGYSARKLLQRPCSATTYPLTEPYWARALADGVQRHVLVQIFERRVLAPTPSNPDVWKVTAGSTGCVLVRLDRSLS